jgi:hypothetical protein
MSVEVVCPDVQTLRHPTALIPNVWKRTMATEPDSIHQTTGTNTRRHSLPHEL